MSAIAAEASTTTVCVGAPSDIDGGPRLVAVTIKAHSRDRVGSVRGSAPQLSSQRLEPVKGGPRPRSTGIGVIGEPIPVLDRHEHGEGAPIPLDDKPLARGGLVEDAAKGSSEVKRGDDSHG